MLLARRGGMLHPPQRTASGLLKAAARAWQRSSSLAGRGRALPQQVPRCAGEQQQAPVACPQAPAGSSSSSGAAPGVQEQPPPTINLTQSRFCRKCGGNMAVLRPEGDKEWRHVCSSCGYIDYFNPRMVVGAIVEHEGAILLCRRAIEPCVGRWTLPAGFMEIGESTAQGAARETREEANAAIDIVAPYTHLDIPAIGQAYILFRAKLAPPYTFSSGPESLEVALFKPQDIPWGELAFSSVAITLRYYCADLAAGAMSVHHGVILKRPGSGPNDPSAFELAQHFALPVGPPS